MFVYTNVSGEFLMSVCDNISVPTFTIRSSITFYNTVDPAVLLSYAFFETYFYVGCEGKSPDLSYKIFQEYETRKAD